MSNTIASRVNDPLKRGKGLSKESKKSGGQDDSDLQDQLQNRMELQQYLSKLTRMGVNGADALSSRILDDISGIDQYLNNPDQNNSSSSSDTTLPDASEINNAESEADKLIAQNKQNKDSTGALSSQSKNSKQKKSDFTPYESVSGMSAAIGKASKSSGASANGGTHANADISGKFGQITAQSKSSSKNVNSFMDYVWGSLLNNSGANSSNVNDVIHNIANNCDPNDTADIAQTEVGGLAGNDNQNDPQASAASGGDQKNKAQVAIGKLNGFSSKNKINVGIRSMMALQKIQQDPTGQKGGINLKGGSMCLPAIKTMANLMAKSKKRNQALKGSSVKDPVEADKLQQSANRGASSIEKKGNKNSASAAKEHKALGNKIGSCFVTGSKSCTGLSTRSSKFTTRATNK